VALTDGTALRYALVDAGVEFKDDKIAISHIINGNWYPHE
jgi:hypothetical protein